MADQIVCGNKEQIERVKKSIQEATCKLEIIQRFVNEGVKYEAPDIEDLMKHGPGFPGFSKVLDEIIAARKAQSDVPQPVYRDKNAEDLQMAYAKALVEYKEELARLLGQPETEAEYEYTLQ
jgi:hypothetical protein